MTFVVVEYEVFCPAGCGVLGEHLGATESDRLVGKHVRQTGHATRQSGAPVPATSEEHGR